MVPGFEHLPIPATVHLNGPAEGIPRVVDTARGLTRAAEQLAAATGPVAIDTERASGFRYGQRAFLVQLRREGAGTILIDPEAVGSLAVVNEALRGVEWVLHAATQDMPCLAELDMHPDRLFDTELGGRLLGLRKVGLASMTEELLGFTLSKEHSAVDWSQRPLPADWLNYAALDVEVLVQLRWATEERLAQAGKLEWAFEEFEHIRAAAPAPPRQDPWRRTHGMGNVRGRRKLTALRNLWQAREALARHKDLAPTRLLPDSAIVAAANAMPRTVPQLMATPGFHGRLASREAPRWLAAVQDARLTEEPVPATVPSDALPTVKGWETKRPEAAARLKALKPAVAELAEELGLPPENLLTPEHLRRFCWQPPRSTSDDAVAQRLRELGARSWQVERVAPVIGSAWRALRARRRADRAPDTVD
ncbi:ribonuclease D [Kocuria tytonis]|uniref:Ribonuclease D n=1 Tax=Kocuria tytonis TaxID=2054280 RepID=A0A495A946_9MICC|nr:HRDC domain-containing protein [Kocuria tytonis]RKQ36293.1 ribonuclease D [Kocuria tytonis]